MKFTPSNHYDRDCLFTDEDRAREAAESAERIRRCAQYLQVVSRGDIPADEAERLVKRDLAIAGALTDHHGIGATESFLFDEVACAQRVGSDTDPLGPFFVSNSASARLGRVWDAIRNFGRDLLAFLGQPSPFN